MTRIAVIGSAGQLGRELVSILGEAGSYDVDALRHADIAVTDPSSVHRALARSRPAAAVNCAAYVWVDDSEDHPEEALTISAVGALNVARACASFNALCVFVSTDHVFDGRKGAPYVDSDPPCPVNAYGMSKLAGEFLVRQAAADWLIVRSASVYGRTGSRGKGGNFVDSILAKARAGGTITVVDDVRMSPTNATDLAQGIEQLLQGNTRGIDHLANAGSATWYEFASAAVDAADVKADIHPVASKEYPTTANRPANSSLRSATGQRLRPWQDALRDYL